MTEGGLCEVRGEAARGKVCLNLLLLWKCRQPVAFRRPDVHLLALIRSWPPVKWTGPPGKGSSINTPRVQIGGVRVRVRASVRALST